MTLVQPSRLLKSSVASSCSLLDTGGFCVLAVFHQLFFVLLWLSDVIPPKIINMYKRAKSRSNDRCLSSTLRSPDVILGLPIPEAVDMWSLGGVLATMYLGSLPFPQRCQYYLVCNLIYLNLTAQLYVETQIET